jgi:hypothetical protein
MRIEMTNDNTQGFLFGMIGGVAKFWFINIEAAMLTRFAEAMITAFFCGVVGMAGKELFTYVKRKYFKK